VHAASACICIADMWLLVAGGRWRAVWCARVRVWRGCVVLSGAGRRLPAAEGCGPPDTKASLTWHAALNRVGNFLSWGGGGVCMHALVDQGRTAACECMRRRVWVTHSLPRCGCWPGGPPWWCQGWLWHARHLPRPFSHHGAAMLLVMMLARCVRVEPSCDMALPSLSACQDRLRPTAPHPQHCHTVCRAECVRRWCVALVTHLHSREAHPSHTRQVNMGAGGGLGVACMCCDAVALLLERSC
jgi:hypothetical protein